ncbi:MAG: hypothetical protein ACRDJE_00525 [Dehalococcoidia bacterium]
MLTYLTLDGDVLDLSGLDETQRAYFDRCYRTFRERRPYDEIFSLVYGAENPLLGDDRRITRAVSEQPLWQAVRDLGDRLGILQDWIGPEPGDEPERDPIADEWIPATQAAASKGVTLAGLHKAVDRGAVIAAPAKPGGVRIVISRNSLERWTPDPVRQAARRRAAAVR